MGLKITGTGTPLRSIFRSLNSYRGARMVSTVKNRSAEAQVSSFSSSVDDSLSSSSSSSPLLMLSPSISSRSYELFSFAKNRLLTIPKSEKSRYGTKIVGSSHGWLACFNYRSNELYLSNPLSGRRINLPPIDNLSVSKPNLIRGLAIMKIIISCSDPESKECRAMMLFMPSNTLAFCCPGISSTQWTTIKTYNVDFVYCATQELLFTLNDFTENLELHVWDLQNPLSPSLVRSYEVDKLEYCSDSDGHSELVENDVFGLKYHNYLVVSQQGELFLVYRCVCQFMLPDGECAQVDPEDDDEDLFSMSRYPPKTVNFKVFKIVREGDGVEKVLMDSHLDDQVMFVGWLSHGIAMPASDADGFQPNTICFTDDAVTDSKVARGTDNGIFDYKNKTLHPCYYPCDYQSLKKKIMPPLWLTPN